MSFSSLGLSAPLLRALTDLGYTTPTPIQQAAIPAILGGQDVWANAQTGSGKTAAFGLPLLQRLVTAGPLVRGKFVRALARTLILVPTRELATQTATALRAYSQHLPRIVQPKIVVAIGGVSINPQMIALGGGADVLVATPGRLLDLVRHNAVSLQAVSCLVLDEADRLLALGFAEELNQILARVPSRRQTLLFSATFPTGVLDLAVQHLHQPLRLDLAPSAADTPAIHQRAIAVDAPRRTQLLRNLIVLNDWTRVLVFVATRYATEHVAEKLRRQDLAAAALHGDLSQGARTGALEDFKASRLRVLVATDVAARGLDIAELPVVVNYDLPRSTADYLHRIGRTGRAGASGVAVSFVSAETEAHFQLIERRHDLRLPREEIAGFEPTEAEVEIVPAHPAPYGTAGGTGGGVKGRRPNKKDKLRAAAGLDRPPMPATPAPAPLSAPASTSALANRPVRPAPRVVPTATELFPL